LPFVFLFSESVTLQTDSSFKEKTIERHMMGFKEEEEENTGISAPKSLVLTRLMKMFIACEDLRTFQTEINASKCKYCSRETEYQVNGVEREDAGLGMERLRRKRTI
jgi:hypothetical protein